MPIKPSFIAYSVRDFEKDGKTDSSWTRIGAAWEHKDGKGLNIQLDALPVNGRITIRPNEPKAAKE